MKTPARRRGTVTVRRIVVAADASAPGRSALDAAIRLAQRLEAELEGLYMEDINLKRLAELPVAREFRFGGAASPFARDAAAVAEDLRTEAMRLRRAFEEAASRARVPASFRVAEGRIEHAIVAESGEADLLVVGFERRSLFPLPRLAPTPAAVAIRPLALYDGTEGAGRALELAARLSDDEPGSLTVVIRAANETEALRLRRKAAQTLAGHEQVARFRSAGAPSLTDLCRAVSANGATALVIASDDVLLEGEGFARMLEDVLCPVLVVR
jgi:nucleotide-binding universal stress UspA family protein